MSQFCAPSDFVERDHIATDVEAIRGGPFTDQLLGDAQAASTAPPATTSSTGKRAPTCWSAGLGSTTS